MPGRAEMPSGWTGLYPYTTGVYGHDQNNYTWRDSPVLTNAVTIFEHFAAHGYETFATGKIFHNNKHTVPLFRKRGEYDRFGVNASFGPYPWDGKTRYGFNVPQLSRFVTREVSQAMQHQSGTVAGSGGVSGQPAPLADIRRSTASMWR